MSDRPSTPPRVVLALTESPSHIDGPLQHAIDALSVELRRVEGWDHLLVELSTCDWEATDRTLVVSENMIPGDLVDQIVHLQLRRIYLPMVVVLRPGQTMEIPFRHVVTVDPVAPVDQLRGAIESMLDMSGQYNCMIRQVALFNSLNPREWEIVKLASSGLPNKSIASRLGISIKTIEKYRRSAYQKLQVQSAAEMASLYTFSQFVAGR